MYRSSIVFVFLVFYKKKFGTFDQILTLVSTGERKGLLIFTTNYPEKESEQK